MTQTSGMWASGLSVDAAPYTQSSWNSLWKYLLGNRYSENAAVIPNAELGGLTIAQRGAGANMSVDVSAGAAIVNGYWYLSTATENLAIATADATNPRYDVVVLEVDIPSGTVRLAIEQGTPAASPTEPSLTQSGVLWQVRLGRITVGAAAASITDSVIENMQEFAREFNRIATPLTNAEGTTIAQGTIVYVDTAGTIQVAASATTAPIGVWDTERANGAEGLFVSSGYVKRLRTTGAITAGAELVISATDGVAETYAGSGDYGQIVGYALSNDAGGSNGYVAAIIAPRPVYATDIDAEISTTSANTSSTSFVTAKTFTKTFSFTPSRVIGMISMQVQGTDVVQTGHHQITQSAGGGTFTAQISAMLTGTGNPGRGLTLFFEVDAPSGTTVTVNLQHRTDNASWSLNSKNISIVWEAIP